jgi:glycerophosphoryl diester phosphodiesterase
VLNIAHRGASGLAPEHTIAAYDLALTEGADYLELDLQMTRDGVLVVLHDATLDRTARGPAADCTGAVADKSREQLRSCEVGSWFNETYPARARAAYVGERIPTLERVFRRYGATVNYYIETKNPETNPGMETELLRLLRVHGLRDSAADHWKVLIQSFSPASLQQIHALDPELPLIQLYPRTGGASVRGTFAAAQEYVVGVGPSYEDADGPLVAAAAEHCLAVHPYTVNRRPEMEALIALGVDGMFTNFPGRLDRALGEDAQGRYRAARRAAAVARACG